MLKIMFNPLCNYVCGFMPRTSYTFCCSVSFVATMFLFGLVSIGFLAHFNGAEPGFAWGGVRMSGPTQ